MTRLPDFHQNATVERASLVSQWTSEIRSSGGIPRNETVGGIHPDAVRLAVTVGAKLVPPAEEILEILSASACVPRTGHLSQTFALIGRARTIGGVRVLVTHRERAFMHTGDNSKRLNAERLLTPENT